MAPLWVQIPPPLLNMTKFNVGDIVRVIRHSTPSDWCKEYDGQIGVVSEYHRHTGCWLLFPDGQKIGFHDYHIELVESILVS